MKCLKYVAYYLCFSKCNTAAIKLLENAYYSCGVTISEYALRVGIAQVRNAF